MPFLRFSRDKRGYEHIYLMHAGSRRGKPGRPRLLYWYRTPPGIKVGRVAFDDEVRRALEAQYPGVTFDWPTIVNTPMPPPEAEPWRERRRQERAAKQLRITDENAPGESEETVEPVDAVPELESAADDDLNQLVISAATDSAAPAEDASIRGSGQGEDGGEADDDGLDGVEAGDEAAQARGGPSADPVDPASAEGGRRPRRRRRRRRRSPSAGTAQAANGPEAGPAPDTESGGPSGSPDALPEGPNSDDR